MNASTERSIEKINRQFSSLINGLSSRTTATVFIFVIAGALGTYFLTASHAATSSASTEPENGSVSAPAVIQNDSSASGGKAIKFVAPTGGGGGGTGSCPSATKNTPDGADPWGGCWPGPATTGYPHGLAGDTRTPVTLSNYTGSCVITTAVTIDSKIFNCDVVIRAKVTIKNSLINGQVYIESDNPATQYNLNWFLTLIDSEVGIGLIQEPVIFEGAMDLQRVNVHGGITSVQCGDKAAQCFIHDTYMHGQLIQVNSNWHLGGFHSIGGTNYDLTHNYVACDQPATYGSDGGCSGDIVFIPTPPDVITHALITKNFMAANTSIAYCFYGGDRPPDLYASYMTITNNIFARGSNNKCGDFGPVAGTNTNSTNIWSGNVWENGGSISPEE